MVCPLIAKNAASTARLGSPSTKPVTASRRKWSTRTVMASAVTGPKLGSDIGAENLSRSIRVLCERSRRPVGGDQRRPLARQRSAVFAPPHARQRADARRNQRPLVVRRRERADRGVSRRRQDNRGRGMAVHGHALRKFLLLPADRR